MTDAHDLTVFHDDTSVAAAIGGLLDGRTSVDDVVSRYGVAPETVANAVAQLGIADHIAADLPDTETDCQQRERPAFLDQREPVIRRRREIRDDTASAIADDTYETPFVRALLSEASQRARDRVSEYLTDEFGSEADRLRVAVSAVPTDREYPAHVRWISVKYPVDDTDDTTSPKVRSPPFPFERFEAALPKTVDATVELVGETFTVRNIPVVATEERWQ